MIIKYTKGFIFNGVIYGWKDKDLYRLPQVIGKRFYPAFKCKPYTNDKQENIGYYVGRKRKSISQLRDMTVSVNFERQIIKDKDCPF